MSEEKMPILELLKHCAENFRSLANKEDVSLGFNAFALVSNTYYKENFHSDILAAILNPLSEHGEGVLFLKQFLTFIADVAMGKGKKELAKAIASLYVDEQVRVVREEGRIDIKIEAETWAIIIENKINGAGDMPRQIPRYIEDIEKSKKDVKAVVYLTLSEEKEPNKNEWKDGDAQKVDPLLIPIIGFSEDASIKNLVVGWLQPCQLSAKQFETRAVFAQYERLIKHQTGETMDNNELKEIINAIGKLKINYSDLLKPIQGIPRAFASMIVTEIKNEFSGRIKDAFIWESTRALCAVVEFEGIKNKFTPFIDIGLISEEGYVSFGIREEGSAIDGSNKERLEAFEKCLKECDPDFQINEKWISFSFDRDEAISTPSQFIEERLKGIVRKMIVLKDRLNSIANNNS
ncbi:MAG: PD-(D/E)XK nuclease family protein [Candidatus Spyradenecus sp.]